MNKIGQMGEYLEIVEVNGRKTVRCSECTYELGPATENWKSSAILDIAPASKAGPLVKLHQELEMREYLCPQCGRLHSVEIALKNDPPLWEAQPKV